MRPRKPAVGKQIVIGGVYCGGREDLVEEPVGELEATGKRWCVGRLYDVCAAGCGDVAERDSDIGDRLDGNRRHDARPAVVRLLDAARQDCCPELLSEVPSISSRIRSSAPCPRAGEGRVLVHEIRRSIAVLTDDSGRACCHLVGENTRVDDVEVAGHEGAKGRTLRWLIHEVSADTPVGGIARRERHRADDVRDRRVRRVYGEVPGERLQQPRLQSTGIVGRPSSFKGQNAPIGASVWAPTVASGPTSGCRRASLRREWTPTKRSLRDADGRRGVRRTGRRARARVDDQWIAHGRRKEVVRQPNVGVNEIRVWRSARGADECQCCDQGEREPVTARPGPWKVRRRRFKSLPPCDGLPLMDCWTPDSSDLAGEVNDQLRDGGQAESGHGRLGRHPEDRVVTPRG